MGRAGHLPAMAVCVSFVIVAGSGQAGEDKSAYSLLDAVPDRLLREFNPDRPGQSHDPTTVDAGHIQLEVGAFEHVFDPRGPGFTTTRRYLYGNPNVRVGVTSDVELQVGTPLGNLIRTSGAEATRMAGLGDTTLAVKANLLGNDGGDHILAVLPTIKLPTAARGLGNGYAEGAIFAPYNYKITKDLLLTFEPSIGVLRNSMNTRYRDSYGLIVGLDQTITNVIIASVEISTQVSSARKEPTNWTFTPSLAYLVSKNLQLDAGVNLGLNKATPRYNPYLGVSTRF